MKTKLIYYFSESCNQCKFLQAPIIKELEAELKDQVDFEYFDIGENWGILEELGFQHVPTMVIIKEGQKEGEKEVVLGPVTKDDLIKALK